MASDVHRAMAAARRSAVHLEMRDVYTPDDPAFACWRTGVGDPVAQYRSWSELVAATVGRGVQVRRARIVSEPVTEYIRFEYAVTAGVNVATGEQVRWLPRRQASDLSLPGNDFWLFDNDPVIFNHFAGDGSSAGEETWSGDPVVVRLCASAFEAVWKRASPHEDYRPASEGSPL